MDEESRQPGSEESPEEEPQKSERRRDRLMSAKERSEEEAKKWSEIEQHGDPVPSRDRTRPEPLITEPPRQEGDTPTGQETPPEGTPRPGSEDDVPFKLPKAEDADLASSKKRIPYPHPTDPVQEPPTPHPTDTPQSEKTPEEKRDPSLYGYKRPDFEEEPHTAELPPQQPEQPQDQEPLPRQVPRIDDNATVVGLSAFKDEIPNPEHSQDTIKRPYQLPPAPEPTRRSHAVAPQQPYQAPSVGRAGQQGGYAQQPTYQPPPPPVQRQAQPARPRRERRRRARRKVGIGTIITRLLILTFVGLLVLGIIGSTGSAIYYAQVTAPSFRGINTIEDLQERSLGFETTRIRDRNGEVLYELNDPEGGFRDTITLDEISPYMIHATVSTEERAFFTNPGFSIPGIVRAVYQNYKEGAVVSGASTITQQVVRALLLTEEDLAERVSYRRKIKEIFLAAELERRFTKEEILELYFNQVYYANLSYGVEAAAQTYFEKSASELTLAEASYLAGIPQAPTTWDPVREPENAALRQRQVLALMIEAGCLDTGDVNIQLPCVTQADVAANGPEISAIASTEYSPPDFAIRHPHWVFYIINQLEQDPAIGASIYSSGFDIYTTLDSELQQAAEQQVESTLSGLVDRNVGNASVVVIDVNTGAILTMVGSRDFFDEDIDGEVNVALTPQQPGSSIKPFTYLAAFRKGWTPATVIWDVPIEYEIPGFGVYEPVNYDGRFRGPVTVREAIANSLNVPAVMTLDFVGVPALLEVLNDVGISSLGNSSNPNNYGLSLTLGAGEVYLLEWANAYATIANGGIYRPVYSIERIERNGVVIQGYPYEVPEGTRVVDADQAYLLQSIMSDTEARIPSFGRETPISPTYPAGAKTGTTNDFRDNWTMGYTTEVAVGVWVGNTDNSPMINVTGVTGAGPIWRSVMDVAAQKYPPQNFPRPPGVFDQIVCEDDGAEPSDYCLENSETRLEVFDLDTPPPTSDNGLYRTIEVDTFTGLIANEFCPNFREERATLFIPNPSQLIDVRDASFEWLRDSDPGKAWAAQRGLDPQNLVPPPTEACGPDTQTAEVQITQPQNGDLVSGNLIIRGTVKVSNLDAYIIEYGLGEDPGGWAEVQGRTSATIENGPIGQLNTEDLDDGTVTIRLIVFDRNGNSVEQRVTFTVDNPDDDND